jgi:hypothetical protein
VHGLPIIVQYSISSFYLCLLLIVYPNITLRLLKAFDRLAIHCFQSTGCPFLSSQASQPHDFEIHLGVIFFCSVINMGILLSQTECQGQVSSCRLSESRFEFSGAEIRKANYIRERIRKKANYYRAIFDIDRPPEGHPGSYGRTQTSQCCKKRVQPERPSLEDVLQQPQDNSKRQGDWPVAVGLTIDCQRHITLCSRVPWRSPSALRPLPTGSTDPV